MRGVVAVAVLAVLVGLAAAQQAVSATYSPDADFVVPQGEGKFVNWKCFNNTFCPRRASDSQLPTGCKISWKLAFPQATWKTKGNSTVYFGAFGASQIDPTTIGTASTLPMPNPPTQAGVAADVKKVWMAQYDSFSVSSLVNAIATPIDVDFTNTSTAGIDAPFYICAATYDNVTLSVRVSVTSEAVYPLVKTLTATVTLALNSSKAFVLSYCGPDAGYGDAGSLPTACGPTAFPAPTGLGAGAATLYVYGASSVTVNGASVTLKDGAVPLATADVDGSTGATFPTVTDRASLPVYVFATLKTAPVNATSAAASFTATSRATYPAVTVREQTINAGSGGSGGMSQRAIIALIVAIVAVVVIIVAVVSVVYCMRAQAGRDNMGSTVRTGNYGDTRTV